MSASVDTKVLAQHIEQGLRELEQFASTAEFCALLDELWAVPLEQRADFVTDVILNPHERDKRGIRVPDGIVLQRSAFRDDRPTLFCMVRYIPEGLEWSKVTITFDNPSGQPALTYSDVASRFKKEVATQSHL